MKGTSWQQKHRDHPRICGEHYGVSPFTPCALGSSPHMRGTLGVHESTSLVIGIIPAYAGNTPNICILSRFARDHPRICGEHVMAQNAPFENPGSSPHMRGTPENAPARSGGLGIIPAYAGNTSPPTKRTVKARDHPRICGEHMKYPHLDGATPGSSPHMRGTPRLR